MTGQFTNKNAKYFNNLIQKRWYFLMYFSCLLEFIIRVKATRTTKIIYKTCKFKFQKYQQMF